MNFRSTVLLLSIVSLVLFLMTRFFNDIHYAFECKRNLGIAVQTESISEARNRLRRAIDLVRKKGATNGYTSILRKTEDENVELWFNNLISALAEVDEWEKLLFLEKEESLEKIRKILTFDGEIVIPNGIAVAPHNRVFFLWGWLSIIVLILSYNYRGKDI